MPLSQLRRVSPEPCGHGKVCYSIAHESLQLDVALGGRKGEHTWKWCHFVLFSFQGKLLATSLQTPVTFPLPAIPSHPLEKSQLQVANRAKPSSPRVGVTTWTIQLYRSLFITAFHCLGLRDGEQSCGNVCHLCLGGCVELS